MQRRLPDPPILSEADLSACRALLANGSRTFMAASYLLPRRVRDGATALYAFCRIADDLIDTSGASHEALAALKARLDHVYDGEPMPYAPDRALAAVVVQYAIPRTLLDALIEGFEWDAAGRRYETLGDLEAYATRVAGTVGAMMALLMGARSPDAIARATDLGIAMQLTNITRDIGEDARAGRIYLPLSWMKEAGIETERWLANPTFSPALSSLIERLLEAADEVYARSETGIARLPADSRRGIYAARLLYAEIGNELARQGRNSVARRAVVPARVKLALLARAMLGAIPASRPHSEPPLAPARFLVDAVIAAPPPATTRDANPMPPWWNMYARAIRLIELIDALEQRDRLQHAERGRNAVPVLAEQLT